MHKPLFSVRKGSLWALCTIQERTVYFTNHCLESEVYLSTQCLWRLRELQNACYENCFAHVNGTSFNHCPQAISVSFYLLSPSCFCFFPIRISNFFIEIQSLCNVVLLSAVQWSKSAMCTHISPPSRASLSPHPHPTHLGHQRALGWTACAL